MTAARVELVCAGRAVAQYATPPDLPATLSPRPCLHPVRTFAGTEVTELMPADHPHHLGVSIAVPDVGGRNFWGGRTFVRDQGPVWLDNHGVQRHLSWAGRAADAFTESLAWIGADGETALRERRDVRAVAAGRHWALDVAFTLTNATRGTLRIGSPATNGRPGAGYGGFFWRAPGTSTGIRVRTPHADGERAVHGTRAEWLALTGTAPDGRAWTLAFLPADAPTAADPWFVRVEEYPGVGSSLAWERPLVLPPGGGLARRVVTVVADGHLTSTEIAGLREDLCPAL